MRSILLHIRNTTLFVLLSTVALITTARAEEAGGSIKGHISTADDKPASMVTVRVNGTKKAATTDDDGNFIIHGLPAGLYDLTVTLVGYEPLTTSVAIDNNKTATVSLQLKLSQSQLREVTVSSTKRSYTASKVSSSLRLNQDLVEIPQNIQVTTAQTFRDLGATSSAELFRAVSGLTALNAKQDIGVSIRGSQLYYSILRNGAGAGYWYNMEADPGMLERAEFIKGPAGYMVSNTEPGGLANMVTKQPTHEKIATANFGFGSWDMMRATADFGGEFKKGGALTYRLNAGYQQQNEYYDFGYFKKYYVAAALKYDIDENTAMTLEYNYVHGHQLTDGQTLQTIGGKRTLPTSFSVVDPNAEGTTSADNYFRFNVKHAINQNWNLNTQAVYVFGPWGGYNMNLAYLPVSNDSLYRNTWYTAWRNKLFTAQAFLDGTFQTGRIEHKIMIGLDFGDVSTSSSGGGDYSSNPSLALNLNAPVYYLPKDSLKNFSTNQFLSLWGNHYSALYIQYNAKFFDKLILTAAGRYTKNVTWANYNDPYTQTDNRFTPRLGLTYLFTKDISVYGLYDQAFVPQSGRSFTNATFGPLTGDDKEIGLKTFWFNRRLSANIDIYKMTKNNALTTDPLHPGFQVQQGQLQSKGLELDINGSVTKNLNIIANYAYTDAKITKSHDSTQLGLYNYGSAKNIGYLFAKYRFLNGLARGFSIGAGARYVGKMTYASDVTKMAQQMMPDYTLLEASVGYSTQKFYINLNAFNLANKKYITGAYAISDTDYSYSPGEPVSFRIDIGLNF